MSRMDRYYKSDHASGKRTRRNHDLYKSIYEETEYSNIEGIANIDKSNEIDIAKIKDLLKSREEYQSGRELKSFIPKEEPIKYETFERDDDRVYDIRDILTQAKSGKEEEKYHNLDEANVDRLNQLKKRVKDPKEVKKVEPKEEESTNTSKLNKLTDNELGLSMLDDLKSDNTATIANESIKSILEEAKRIEEEKTKTSTNTGLDNSFFTSSLSFTNSDFEQVNIKKHKDGKKIIKILVIAIMVILTILVFLFMFNTLK